ncbi:Tyrosine recombinase XerD [compost metagenome]
MVEKLFRQPRRHCKALLVADTKLVKRKAIPTLRWALKRLATRGVVEANVYPHRFRHTYACQLLDNGALFRFYSRHARA